MRSASPSVTVPILALLVAGCAEMNGPTAPTPVSVQPDASSSEHVIVASPVASPWTEVRSIPALLRIEPETLAAIEACVDEAVTFVGEVLVVAHVTTLPDGSRQLVLHHNPQGLVASGASSGRTYRAVGSDSVARVSAPSGTYVNTFTATIRFIGPGGGPGFEGRILRHVTITPTGDITAAVSMLEADCSP